MKRGDLVTVAAPGDFGKPRPALVIQDDRFDALDSVTVLLISGSVVNSPLLRVTVEPTAANGLLKTSQVMVDKAITLRRDRIGQVIGQVEGEVLSSVERCLAVFLGIAR